MRRQHQCSIHAAAFTAGLLLFAPSTLGQNALGDGRALDANLNVGGGRINPLRIQDNFAARNDLVTGNVTGLGYFRDDIDYAAPNAFRDESSSDELFRFHAISAAPTRSLASPGNLDIHDPISYFDAFAARRAQPIQHAASIYEGYRPFEAGAYRAFDVSARPGAAAYGISRSVGQALSLTRIDEGRLLQVTASPLLGVRSSVVDPAAGLGLTLELPKEGEEAAEADVDAIEPERLTLTPIAADLVISDLPQDVTPILRPALVLGQRLDERIELPRMHGPTLTFRQQAAQVTGDMFESLADRIDEAGDDVYLNLLARLRQRAAEITGIGPNDADARIAEMISAAEPGPPDAAPALPYVELEEPDEDQRRLASIKRRLARRIMLGLEPQADFTQVDLEAQVKQLLETYEIIAPEGGVEDGETEAEVNALAAAVDPTIDLTADPTALADTEDADAPRGFDPTVDLITPDSEALQAILRTAAAAEPLTTLNERDQLLLEDILDLLAYDLPPLSSLAGKRQARINNLMAEAEHLMAKQRYFDAEENYRLVLIGVPRHPMARVGIIHSQLGAGLIRSAAFNLRTLFEQHPELISARYEARLLPDGDRLKWARGEIEKMIDLTRRPEPAVLLAYLAFQVDQPKLVEYGLDLAEARSPLDPLLLLLRRIWLEREPPAVDAAALDTPGTTGTPNTPDTPDAPAEADAPDDPNSPETAK